MAVDDIHALMAQDFQRATGQKNKPRKIIGIIALLCAIQELAIEITIGANQENNRITSECSLENARCFLAI
jgi:hypothetical protein